MSKARNHHYVPQFYLRNFSSDGRSIRAINLTKPIYIPQASIRRECKKRGFHDYHPDIEPSLCKLEGITAAAIKKIISSERLPARVSEDHMSLARFIAIQRSRTLKVAGAFQTVTDKALKLACEDDPKLKNVDIFQWRIGYKHQVAITLGTAAKYSYYAIELGAHLFVNETGDEFITSDNPVVAHNQYCECITCQGVLGWNCSGLQIIFPISPRLAILLYDTGVYAVGGARNRDITRITDVAEVRNINAFQIVSADNNIYFLSEAMVPSLFKEVDLLQSKRKIKRNVLVQTERVDKGGETSELVHEYERVIPLNLRLASVRIKRNMRRIPLHVRATMRRRKEPVEGDAHGGDAGPRVRYPVRRSFRV